MADVRVGERIRRLRELRKITRESLAERINVSTKFLYEIETGKKGFSADILGRIARDLSVSCDYILFGGEMAGQSPERALSAFETPDTGRIGPDSLNPAQVSKIQDILQLLYEMCSIS